MDPSSQNHLPALSFGREYDTIGALNYINSCRSRRNIQMKRLKQITALIGVIVLLGLYVSTVVLACIGSDTAMRLLRAAIYATIVLPVLLWLTH